MIIFLYNLFNLTSSSVYENNGYLLIGDHMRLFYSNCSEDANIFLENTHQGFLLLNGALVVPHSPPIFTGETNSVFLFLFL